MAKRISGERTLKVGGESLTLRLDFAALAAIEDEFNKTIFDLFGEGYPSASVIVFAFAQMSGITREEAFSIVESIGIIEVLLVVKEVIIETLNPEKKKPGKQVAAGG